MSSTFFPFLQPDHDQHGSDESHETLRRQCGRDKDVHSLKWTAHFIDRKVNHLMALHVNTDNFETGRDDGLGVRRDGARSPKQATKASSSKPKGASRQKSKPLAATWVWKEVNGLGGLGFGNQSLLAGLREACCDLYGQTPKGSHKCPGN